MPTEPKTRRRWSHGATPATTAKVSRIARAAASEIGCTAKTAQHLLHSSSLRVAAFVRQCRALGDHEALAALLRPIEQAKRQTIPVLTDALLANEQAADAREDECEVAYLRNPNPVTRDTWARQERKQAALSTAIADALDAEGAA